MTDCGENHQYPSLGDLSSGAYQDIPLPNHDRSSHEIYLVRKSEKPQRLPFREKSFLRAIPYP